MSPQLEWECDIIEQCFIFLISFPETNWPNQSEQIITLFSASATPGEMFHNAAFVFNEEEKDP